MPYTCVVPGHPRGWWDGGAYFHSAPGVSPMEGGLWVRLGFRWEQTRTQWGCSAELQPREKQQTGNVAGQRYALEISGLFFKNSHCLYAKSLRIWKLYQLASNAIYAFLTMTRSRYLEKHLRQGNACRDAAQNTLPASNNLQGRDCLAHTGWVYVHQSFTDFSDDSLNSWRPLSPSTSHGKEFHRDHTWCLKSHLGFCPATPYPLVSFLCLLWKSWWNPSPVLHCPGTQRLSSSLLRHLFSS